jgi:FkbM family methyltransferase
LQQQHQQQPPPQKPSPSLAYDSQRSRVRLHPFAEAGARIAFAWLGNRHGFRERRPLVRFATRTAEFFAMRAERAVAEADMNGGLHVLVSTSDRTIGRSVYACGDWDPLLVGTVFDALHEYGYPHRGKTFLEVGANFGVYSLPAVASYGFARSVAYEPDPSSFALLEQNIERNRLSASVTAHNAALSAAAGELTLQLGTYNAGDNRIVDSGSAGASDDDGGQFVNVPARTFDAEVAAGRIPLDDLGLAWIDVQGHELAVLRGASTLLAARVPLVIEYATSMLEPSARVELEDLLAGSYRALVDLGWCALTDRLRFQPADAIRRLAADGRAIETDLLLLP